MGDNEYTPGNSKSLKISIGSLVINPKILRVILDHLKTKKMCKHAA